MWTINMAETPTSAFAPLYDPRIADRGYIITDDADCAIELSCAGRLSFTVPSINPRYGSIKKMQSIVELYRGEKQYFRGRVLSIERNFLNQARVVCEGELAYLNDTTQRPFTFPQTEDKTGVADYLSFLVERHNAEVQPYQRFVLGRVTVQDPNDYIRRSDTEYSSTWKLVKEGLLDILGGYLWIRRENGVNYLDYLADFDQVSGQSITFAKNLLDINTAENGADVFSAVIPLGAKGKDTGERLTLSELPDEDGEDICKKGDLIYSKAAVAAYGWIIRPAIHDDVTTTNILKQRGISDLGAGRAIPKTIKLTAADLSGAGYDVEGFYIGQYAKVVSPPHQQAHGLASSYLVKRMDFKLFSPGSNTITVGATSYGFIEQQAQQTDKTHDIIIGTVEDQVGQTVGPIVDDLKSYADSAVQQSDEEIRAEVSQKYYTKGETDTLVGEEFTKVSQTVDGIQIDFRRLDQTTAGNSAGLQELNSFIRLEGGKITIAQENDKVKLIQSNNRLAFVQKGTELELAYISDGRFFAPKMTITDELVLGGFSLSTENGLAVKWIGG